MTCIRCGQDNPIRYQGVYLCADCRRVLTRKELPAWKA